MRIVAGGTVAVILLATACGSHDGGKSATTTPTTTTTTTTAPPVAEDALKGLLLSPDQINAVMGATDMRAGQRRTALSDDIDTMQPRECLAIDGAGQAVVYANTGYTAVRGQTVRDGDEFDYYVDQVVVLFPAAKRAAAFFDISAELWPSCHEYTHIQSGSQWTAGPVSKAAGVLTATATQRDAGNSTPWACGRALAARNNVVIDVNTCSADPKDTASVIAGQIAARVPMQ